MELWRRNLLVLWVGTVFAGISFSLVSPFLPMLLKDVGVVENLEVWSGWAFAATFYTSALMAPLWGSLADKYGRRLQLVRAGMGIGATYILLSFATNGWQEGGHGDWRDLHFAVICHQRMASYFPPLAFGFI